MNWSVSFHRAMCFYCHQHHGNQAQETLEQRHTVYAPIPKFANAYYFSYIPFFPRQLNCNMGIEGKIPRTWAISYISIELDPKWSSQDMIRHPYGMSALQVEFWPSISWGLPLIVLYLSVTSMHLLFVNFLKSDNKHSFIIMHIWIHAIIYKIKLIFFLNDTHGVCIHKSPKTGNCASVYQM